jgi:serine/threonine protein kinase
LDKYIKEKEKDKERDRDRERAEREKDKDFNPTKHWKSVRVKWTTDADASWPNVNNELQAISMLGKGSFATVYEAYDRRLKLNVAVKVYEKKDLSMPERRIFIQNEIDIMANIGHPAIVKFYRLLEDSKAIYIVQEIGGNMSLSEFVRHGKDKKLEEADARQLFKELVSSTTYLHSLKICHRDLKLTNILINGKGRLKLIDFGFSTISNR